MNNYYIITDSNTEKILVSKNMMEIYEFITKNQKSKIRTINHTAKPQILHRDKFLKIFFEATENQNKLFELAKIMIKRTDNMRKFIKTLSLLKNYDYYEANKEIL